MAYFLTALHLHSGRDTPSGSFLPAQRDRTLKYLDHSFGKVMPSKPFSIGVRTACEAIAQSVVLGKGAKALSECNIIFCINAKRRFPPDLRQTRSVRHKCRNAESVAFHDGQTKTFVERRQHEKACIGVEKAEIALSHISDELYIFVEA